MWLELKGECGADGAAKISEASEVMFRITDILQSSQKKAIEEFETEELHLQLVFSNYSMTTGWIGGGMGKCEQ